MTDKLSTLIKELSQVYDPESNNTYISLYFNREDKKFLEKRIKACKTILKGEELNNFIETIDEIKNNILNKNFNQAIAVFASHKHNFKKYISLSIKLENLLVVDSSPYIRPLARIHDEYESFTLVLVSTNYAKIFSISLGKVDDTKKLSAYIMNKHKKGGWSQARFNRLRKGAIHAFLSEVAEELTKRADDRIIIAGPGVAKHNLIDMLSKNLRERVIDVIDIGINDENKLLKQSVSLVSEKEEEKSHKSVQVLKEEILRDGMAVYGINETLKAVINGQIELLLIQKDIKIKGWICEHCQIVEKGTKKTCPYCSGRTSEVDMLEEILEFAERTDAKVEFTDDEELKKLGYVAGILRFK